MVIYRISTIQETVEVPFKSKAQARFLYAKHPEIAKRWAKESGKKHPIKGLPARKRRKK